MPGTYHIFLQNSSAGGFEKAVTSVLLLRWSSMVVKKVTVRWPSILRHFSEEKVT